jgi:5-methylcytosine-specific restriction endonuclease McrBC regulatory subunit McrC
MNFERQPYTIEEYKSKDVYPTIPAEEINYLKKSCFKYESLKPYIIRELKDHIEIENTSYSGIIQTENYRFQFSTKVATNLFYMLSFLKNEDFFLYDPEIIIDIKEGYSFFDILGRLFLNELEELFRQGIYKKYVRKEENISFLKGKLLIHEQIRNDISKKVKFNCSYDDLTYNNLENQIVLKATTLLIPLIRYNNKIKSELKYFENRMKEEVSLVNISPEECDKIQYNRLNDYYETIIKFSKVILQNYFIRSTYHGVAKGFNFIVNMNRVFEDFITEMIKEIISEEEFSEFRVYEQKKFDTLVKERKIITKPDVILERRGKEEYPIIIDAKYKRQENNADYYQVIAYALAIPSSRACFLIYPSDEENIISEPLTIEAEKFGNRDEDIKLYSVKVDLLIDEDLNFNQYIEKIKFNIKKELLKSGQFLG